MRYLWSIPVWILLILSETACQTSRSTPLAPESIEVQTVTPDLPFESTQAQSLAPTLELEDATMNSPAAPDGAAQKMVILAKEHLAKKLDIPVEQIALLDVKPVVWRDAGLECPKPGIDYMRVATPGYNILLEAVGKTYIYHTDQANRFVACNGP